MILTDIEFRRHRASWLLLVTAAVVVFAADLATKVAVRANIGPNEYVGLLPGIDLVHVTNRGIAFGLFPDRQRMVGIVTALVLCGVAIVLLRATHRSRTSMVAAGALVGGAVGNLIDRMTRDGVTDFIDIWRWPPFNIADIGIVLGAAALAVSLTKPSPSPPL